MARKKRYRKKKKTMKEKAESYSTWFDLQRARFLKSNENSETVGEALLNFKDFSRRVMIGKAIEMATDMAKDGGIRLSPNDLATMSQETVDKINRSLSVPLAPGDPIVAVCELLLKNAGLREVSEKKDWGVISCLLAYFDIMGTVLGMESLMAENSELMIIDSDIVKKVLKSKNEPISGDDLEYVPFKTMTLEFSNPVPLVGDIKARAVSFVVRKRLRLRSVIWHFDNVLVSNGPFGLQSMMVDMHVGEWSKFMLDVEARRLAGLPNETLSAGVPATAASFGLRREADLTGYTLNDSDSDSQYMEFFTDMQVKSRNIWDFVTCRNIDYEECPREPIPGKSRSKHVSSNGDHSNRKFRILRINKRIKKGGGGAPIPSGDNSVHVPAMFHYWVYCRDCGRVHRKDLIGKPCRRCRLAVGPISNMKVEKHWHSDYWVGEGLAEETVWGVRER